MSSVQLIKRPHIGWDHAATRRAFSLALAAWLSFAFASQLHLHNAYWAAMPVWAISQPTRGVLLERSIFRVVGTILGAAFGFAIIHLPSSPFIQPVLLALWIGLHAGLTHLHRGVHGYGSLLCGITAAIVAIPSIMAPEDSMLLALARVDCTLIGVVVGTLVMAFLTPESPMQEFYAHVRSVSSEAVAYAARLLQAGDDDIAEEKRLLGTISQLESTARLAAAGSMKGYRRQRYVDLLIVGTLSSLAAAREVSDERQPIAPGVSGQLGRLAEHLQNAGPPAPFADRLALDDRSDSSLHKLESAINDLLAADQALTAPPGKMTAAVDSRQTWLAPHREWGLATRSGLAAFAAVLLTMVAAMLCPGPFIGALALSVCVFVQILNFMPVPQAAAPKMLAGVLLGSLIAMAYRLWLQPHLADTAGLMLTLIPFLVLAGFARAHPKAGSFGVDPIMCFLMAAQLGMPATSNVFLIVEQTAPLTLGAILVSLLHFLRPRSLQRQIRDAARTIRRDLLVTIELDTGADPLRWQARCTRHILRLALHLGRLGEDHPGGLLATLNLGRTIIDLQNHGMPDPARKILAQAMQQEIRFGQASDELARLAESGLDVKTRVILRRLAANLMQSAELLSYQSG